jgi:hypothetical protein
MKNKRRDFLKQVTGLTAAMAAVPVLIRQSAEAETAAPEAADPLDPDAPFIVTGRFALELEGVFAGFLKGFGGGDAFGEVVDEAPDAQGFVKKHLNAPFYNEIVIEVGPGMSQAFWDWIKTTFARQFVTHSGAIEFYRRTRDRACLPGARRSFKGRGKNHDYALAGANDASAVAASHVRRQPVEKLVRE